MNTPKCEGIGFAEGYFREQGLDKILCAFYEGGSQEGVNEKLDATEPYKPDLVDLCRLHRFVLEKKRTTIVEFGTGWSTWVMADALFKNKRKA